MRTDHKELSEHLMLVDLARNDLARICTPGSRYVADLTKVYRFPPAPSGSQCRCRDRHAR